MSAPISSLQNPKIKRILGLAERRARDESGLFFADGVRMVAEAAHARADVDTLVVAPALLTDPRGREVAAALARRGVPCLEVSEAVMRRLSRRANPKGLAAVVRQRWSPLDELRLAGDQLALALDEVADPGNLGTILRTCDAVGAAAVVLIGDATDPYHPTALSATTGAIFSQRLVRATFERFAAWKRARGYPLVGTAAEEGRDYRAVRYPWPTVLLMGGESRGLAADRRALCDLLVSIPMVGRVSSLNLAVATGVLLYELFDRRRR